MTIFHKLSSDLLVNFLLYCALTFMVISVGDGVALILLVFVFLYSLWRFGLPKFSCGDWWLFAAIATFLAIDWLDFVVHEKAILAQMDISAEPVFALLLLVYLALKPLNKFIVWAGIASGAMLACLLGLWQVIVLDYERAGTTANVIQFGDMSILFSYLSLLGLAWAHFTKQKHWWLILLCLGCLVGMLSSILSGTRGSWLSIPVFALLLTYTVIKWKIATKKVVLMGLLLGIVGAGFLYILPATGVKARIQGAQSDFIAFLDGNKNFATANTGDMRLNMWKMAFLLIDKAPIFGLGERGYEQHRDRLVAEGKMPEEILEFNESHNQLITTYMRNGIIGVTSLLILYLVPLLLFGSMMRRDNDFSGVLFAFCGIVVVVCTIVFGLTQTFFGHANGLRFFLFLVVVFWSLTRDANTKNKGSLEFAHK